MEDLGYDIDFASEEWANFTTQMRLAGGALPDFSKIRDDLFEVSKIL
jgi:hypothetical protein